MATAVLDLWPGTKVSIGPPIDDGFYYDFEFPDGRAARPRPTSSGSRRRCASTSPPTSRSSARELAAAEAIERFRAEDQPYKVELIEDLVRDEGVETVSLYRNGPFTDLCRGPHAPSTGRIKAFKLNSIAGAYWRGDENRQMLTRIYGTAFFIAEGPRRSTSSGSSRRASATTAGSGPQLGLFMLRAGGARDAVLAAAGDRAAAADRGRGARAARASAATSEIKTPQVLDEELWHRSGHWDNYRENMFFVEPAERDAATSGASRSSR